MTELLVGCGNSRIKKMGFGKLAWDGLVTIDHDPNCGADIVHNLDETPWPVDDNAFDEVHAYEVLEHLGTQGDYRSFFAHFYEIWRALKDGGHLFATCPSYKSMWAWGDPSHKRIINAGSLSFLSQEQYELQIGTTAMTDFRWLWSGDLRCVHAEDDGEHFMFVLRAYKE